MTTSARLLPFRSPSFPPVLVRSLRLSAPVAGRFLFLPLRSASLSFRAAPVPDTQLPVLPFCPPRVPPPSGFLRAPVSSFDSSGSSPSLPPGFPFGLSGSAYSAPCSFPFALPCFAPTAVPQVLRFSSAFYSLSSSVSPCVRSLRFHPASFPPLSFRFAPVRLGSRYSASASSFPSFHAPPYGGFPCARGALRFLSSASFALVFRRFPCFALSSFRSCPLVTFHSLGTQLRCSSLHRFTVRLTVALRAACLPSRVQAFPLTPLPLRFLRFRFRLRFGLPGILIHPEN